ncbi:hypothetical protein CO689_00355 (plasmid) [Staphylococcus simulans]|nr:hypothetical protein CO689_00355 [Staphylococcus simulans]
MQVFASDFLQIPPHDGHPCLSLTVPTAKPVMDFHHQVVNHAERTQTLNLSNRRLNSSRYADIRLQV